MADIAGNIVTLPTVVDLDALDLVRDQLLEATEAGPAVVSGAQVERVSTNAMLLLISAAETARRNGFTFAVTEPSAPMTAAVAQLGLEASFAGMMKG